MWWNKKANWTISVYTIMTHHHHHLFTDQAHFNLFSFFYYTISLRSSVVVRKEMNGQQQHGVFFIWFYDPIICWQKKLFVRSNLRIGTVFWGREPLHFHDYCTQLSTHRKKKLPSPKENDKNMVVVVGSRKVGVVVVVLTFVWRWRKDPVRLKVPPLAMTSLRRIWRPSAAQRRDNSTNSATGCTCVVKITTERQIKHFINKDNKKLHTHTEPKE